MNSLQAGLPFNIEALLQVHRRNTIALTNANRVIFDGLQTLAQRQGELFKSTVDDYGKVTGDVLAGASFEEKAVKQVAGARHIYVSSVVLFQELSDIALKTNVAAVGILNARISEAFDEFRALFGRPAAPTATAPAAIPAVVAEPSAAAEAPVVVAEVPVAEAVAAEPSTVVDDGPSEDADIAAEPEPTDSAAATGGRKKAGRGAKSARRPRSRR